jgi:Putative Ig domain
MQQHATGSGWSRLLGTVVISAIVAACGDETGGAKDTAAAAAKPGNGNGSGGRWAANSPPVIEGTPATEAEVGVTYAFAPEASDPDGDRLTFRIDGQPAWTSFDSRTGTLNGTPSSADVGASGPIVITVVDRWASASLPAFSITVPEPGGVVNPPPQDLPPVISGTPPTSVMQEQAYEFLPVASDPEGATLAFSVANAPGWAKFDATSGHIYGVPGAGDVGTYAGVVISASDGTNVVDLPAFDVEVLAVAMGSATVSWVAPTQNVDGTPLVDLAGYKVFYGQAPGDFAHALSVPNAGITSLVIENLVPATWYFTVKSVNGAGMESDFSDVASKTIL